MARRGEARPGEGANGSMVAVPRIKARRGEARPGLAGRGKVKAGRFSVLPFFVSYPISGFFTLACTDPLMSAAW